MLEPVIVKVKHAVLEKYIAYYYFLTTESDDFEAKYYAFPHTYTVLNIHCHAAHEINKYQTSVEGVSSFSPVSIVQGLREHPILIRLKGKLNKVTILFKPMGINAFIPEPFGQLIQQPSQEFSVWNNNRIYQQFLSDFFTTGDLEAKATLLEDFLLSMLKPVPDSKKLDLSIHLLSDFEQNLTLEDICDQLDVHPRTFNRLFKKHLGITPAGYRKVARFRHSLQNKLLENQVKRMTDLAYQSNYYDQSYFNKIYQSLTGTNPGHFFKQIETLADNRLVFQFL